MLLRIALILYAVLFFTFASGQSFDYLPTSTTGQVVKHSHYTLSYSEKHEQAEWVAYRLTDERVTGNHGRTNDFRQDPKVNTGTSTLSDHKGSGYDRGHLAPAKTMAFSAKAMSESFYLSNMSPQEASFNRGIWRKLEKQVRGWAQNNEEVYVVSGPVLNACKDYIGPNRVCVPKRYYKVILDNRQPDVKAIGFLLPNKKGRKPLKQHAVSIDHLENVTSIDFFHNLPDGLESRLEGSANVNEWDFTTSFTPSNNNSDKKSSAKRCKGKTQKGKRCQRNTKNADQYCWQHQDQKGNIQNSQPNNNDRSSGNQRCKGMTNDGDRCKRKTSNASGYCWQHED